MDDGGGTVERETGPLRDVCAVSAPRCRSCLGISHTAIGYARTIACIQGDVECSGCTSRASSSMLHRVFQLTITHYRRMSNIKRQRHETRRRIASSNVAGSSNMIDVTQCQ